MLVGLLTSLVSISKTPPIRCRWQFQRAGEIGVPCVAPSCSCLGGRKGQDERRTKKNAVLLVPRRALFFVGGLASSAASFVAPRQAFRFASLAGMLPSVSGSKASCFRGSLLARGFLASPRVPVYGAPRGATCFRGPARPFSFAPLLGRPPGGDFCGALKRDVFSVAAPCHHFPQRLCWCQRRSGRRRQEARPPAACRNASTRTLSGRVGLPGATGRRRSRSVLGVGCK